ncbi:MAG TPA: hypothetical protein VGJ20_05335 [Xanthobacteraceae bacterium]|jgi:hypothetical protein
MLLTAVAACAGTERFGGAPPQSPAAFRPPAAPSPQLPPVNLGGRWRLAAAAGVLAL